MGGFWEKENKKQAFEIRRNVQMLVRNAVWNNKLRNIRDNFNY